MALIHTCYRITDIGRSVAPSSRDTHRTPHSVREGGSRLCFVKDPDQYRVEIIEQPSVAETNG